MLPDWGIHSSRAYRPGPPPRPPLSVLGWGRGCWFAVRARACRPPSCAGRFWPAAVSWALSPDIAQWGREGPRRANDPKTAAPKRHRPRETAPEEPQPRPGTRPTAPPENRGGAGRGAGRDVWVSWWGRAGQLWTVILTPELNALPPRRRLQIPNRKYRWGPSLCSSCTTIRRA